MLNLLFLIAEHWANIHDNILLLRESSSLRVYYFTESWILLFYPVWIIFHTSRLNLICHIFYQLLSVIMSVYSSSQWSLASDTMKELDTTRKLHVLTQWRIFCRTPNPVQCAVRGTPLTAALHSRPFSPLCLFPIGMQLLHVRELQQRQGTALAGLNTTSLSKLPAQQDSGICAGSSLAVQLGEIVYWAGGKGTCNVKPGLGWTWGYSSGCPISAGAEDVWIGVRWLISETRYFSSLHKLRCTFLHKEFLFLCCLNS